MPNTTTVKKAKRDLAQGKSQSTAAGEFVREEMHHIREGKHGAKNTKQAIAIGLSQARRAGIMARPGATASRETKKKAVQDLSRAGKRPNPTRAWSSLQARRKEPQEGASFNALSRQAKETARKRRRQGGANSPSAAARRAARTRKRQIARPAGDQHATLSDI